MRVSGDPALADEIPVSVQRRRGVQIGLKEFPGR
jgi:hypothetical protein